MAEIICIAIPKGGVGKTTTAVNLAASFAVFEKRTLLIDTDTFGACALALGFTQDKIKGGLYEVYNYVHSLSQVIHRTELPFLDFIPANVGTIQREERLLRLAENKTLLRNILQSVTSYYDFIILDTPPVSHGLTTAALLCATSVLIPIRAGYFSLEGIEKLLQYLEWIRTTSNKSLFIEGIVQTMYEPHTKATEITDYELQQRFRKCLLQTHIPRSTQLNEASFYGKPGILFNANSKGTQAYLELAREIFQRLAERNAAKVAQQLQQDVSHQA
ncbi:MAG TPA: ParA family protein [Bacteroidota bacterium]|jgi:chromosome partitioning protein|nr:ParA family protein [Bacteroidota bacterium]